MGGSVYISALGPGAYVPRLVSTLAEAEKFYADHPPGLAWNIYCATAIRKPGAKTFGKESVIALTGLWVDLDFSRTPEAEARERLAEFPMKPSAVIHSGGGLHVHFLFREPELVAAPAPFEAMLRGLAEALGGDRASAEISHVLRPAHYSGEMNFPSKRKRAKGREAAPVVAEYFNGARYNPSDFEPWKAEPDTATTPPVATGNPKRGGLSPTMAAAIRNDPALRKIWTGKWPDPNGEGRSGHDAALTMGLVARGYSDPEIAAALMDFDHGKAPEQPPKYIERGIAAARKKAAATQTPEAQAAREFIAQVREAANSQTWGGRERVIWFRKTEGGPAEPVADTVSLSDALTVFEAILLKGEGLGLTRFRMSERKIAEASGRGRDVVHRAKIALADKGFLKRGPANDDGTELRILKPKDQNRAKDSKDSKNSPPVNHWYGNAPFLEYSSGHDCFRHGALGAKGWQVLVALGRLGPMKRKEIQQATGLPKWTVGRKIMQLLEAGAVSKDGTAYSAQPFDMEAAAELFGTAGRQERQIARHAYERAIWQERKLKFIRDRAEAQASKAHAPRIKYRKPEPQAPRQGEPVAATLPPAPPPDRWKNELTPARLAQRRELIASQREQILFPERMPRDEPALAVGG